jgi:hypothetical protein
MNSATFLVSERGLHLQRPPQDREHGAILVAVGLFFGFDDGRELEDADPGASSYRTSRSSVRMGAPASWAATPPTTKKSTP